MQGLSFKSQGKDQVDWLVSSALISYENALELMTQRVHQLQQTEASELVWLLEHPSLYTLGTSAQERDILEVQGLPTYKTGRGGKVTYHGPGQRVVYLMLDLRQRCMDLKAYVWTLEEWIIRTLKEFGVSAERRVGKVGIWVKTSSTSEAKIAALGVRVQKWVTSHGIALNVDPDLAFFNGIIPCGLQGQGVTSLSALGIKATLDDVDHMLRQKFTDLF